MNSSSKSNEFFSIGSFSAEEITQFKFLNLFNFSLPFLEEIVKPDMSYKDKMALKELISPFGMGESFQVATGDI